jgi:hypothetical protein
MTSNEDIAGRRRRIRVVARGHLVGPPEQLVAVVLRNAEQIGDGLQWQFAGHLLDEVAGTPPPRPCDVLRRAASSSLSAPIARG